MGTQFSFFCHFLVTFIFLYFCICRWLSAYDGNPGFTSEAFDSLKQYRNGERGWMYRHCAVMVDGMKIRKFMHDQTSKRHVGFVDFGPSVEKDDDHLAIRKRSW